MSETPEITFDKKAWDTADDIWSRANSAMDDADPHDGPPRNVAAGVVYDEIKHLTAALSAANERAERLREAALLRITDWDRVTQPGAAAEGCPDPEDVAALRQALNSTPEPPATGASPSAPPAQKEYPK